MFPNFFPLVTHIYCSHYSIYIAQLLVVDVIAVETYLKTKYFRILGSFLLSATLHHRQQTELTPLTGLFMSNYMTPDKKKKTSAAAKRHIHADGSVTTYTTCAKTFGKKNPPRRRISIPRGAAANQAQTTEADRCQRIFWIKANSAEDVRRR